MKIISKDNHNRESVSDVLIAENVNPYLAEYLTALLNERFGPNSPNFFKVVPDDYKLYIFEP